MASNINPFNIDGSFPIAGQDNDSQGFRDNFTNIRNNLGFAKNEIEDLQAKAVLKSPLSGATLDNNMNGATMSRVNLKSITSEVFPITKSPFSNVITVNYNNGNVQFYKIDSGSVSVEFTNWPSGTVCSSILLWVYVSNPVAYTLSLPIKASDNTAEENGYYDLAGGTVVGGDVVIRFDEVGNYMFECVTTNNGRDVVVREVSRNFKTFRDQNFYHNPRRTTFNNFFIGYDTNDALIRGISDFEDVGNHTVSIRGAVNSVTAGNLSGVTVSSTNMSLAEGNLGGFAMTTARGNLAAGQLDPVNSDDYVGYISSSIYSDNNFHLSSVLGFHATGTRNLGSGTNNASPDTSNGLGGNVAIYTKEYGSATMSQALGIESNKSVKFFGNIVANTLSQSQIPQGTPGERGEIVITEDYMYVCISGSDVSATWKRVPLSAFS